jgi:hypothetical protein
MTLRLRTYHKPKGGAAFTEITNYVIRSGNARLFHGRGRTPSGTITFDDILPAAIKPHDEIKLSIDDGTEFHFFSGLFIPSNEQSTDITWRFESYNRLLKKRRVSSVYLQKTRKQIMTLILDEYFPEISYDDTSFPDGTTDADTELLDARFDSKFASEIFDQYAGDLGRIWDVDKDKVMNVKTDSYPSSSYTVTDQQVLGKLRVNYDISRWRTQARVEGASTEIVKQKDFTGTEVQAAASVITLEFSPKTVEVKQISSGSDEGNVAPLRGAIADSDQDADLIDYYYNPRARTITFTDNVSITASDTFRVRQIGTSQIVSEQINPTAYAKHGLVETNPYVNKLITSQQQADEFALGLAEKYGEPLEVYSFNTVWSQYMLPGWTVDLNAPRSGIVKAGVKTMELAVQWSERDVTFNALLNNVNLDVVDVFEQFNLRVRQLEEKDHQSDTFVKKIILWYANIAIEIFRVRVTKYSLGNAFRFDDTSGTGNFDNASRYLDGVNGGGSLTFVNSLEVYNPARKIKLFFNDSDEWDSTLSTATLDTDACEVTF